jgi:hypothetical protein
MANGKCYSILEELSIQMHAFWNAISIQIVPQRLKNYWTGLCPVSF